MQWEWLSLGSLHMHLHCVRLTNLFTTSDISSWRQILSVSHSNQMLFCSIAIILIILSALCYCVTYCEPFSLHLFPLIAVLSFFIRCYPSPLHQLFSFSSPLVSSHCRPFPLQLFQLIAVRLLLIYFDSLSPFPLR